MFQTLPLPSSDSVLQFQSPASGSRSRSSLPFSGRPLASVRRQASVQRRPETPASGNPPPCPASLYEVLRVRRDASVMEIKAAYRKLAKIYHPDSAEGSDGRNFIEIRHAYETLSDPATRAVYDLSIGGRRDRLMPASFGFTERRRSGFYPNPTRRWETDQCW